MTTPAFSLNIELTHSRQFVRLVVLAHVASLLAIVFLNLTWPWLTLGAAAVALHALLMWWDTRWIWNLKRFSIAPEGCTLWTRDGQSHFGPASGYFVSPWLVVLRVPVASKQRLLPLFADSADRESLRRLRVILRCSPQLGGRPL